MVVKMDANATTPLAEEVLEAMLPYLVEVHGNPSSIHSSGRAARAAIDEARAELADLLGGKPHELIFTSGGTESCNMGVIGLARALSGRGRHILTSPTEHHAVLHAVEYLCRREGWEATMLAVDRWGRVSPEDFEAALRADTVLATVMHANNETGVIQPVAELAHVAESRGVVFHTDAVQSFGKVEVGVGELGAGAMSLAAHKFYGPKGVGLLWVRSGLGVERVMHGGAQEKSLRPGTENTAGIVGMAVAAELAEGVRREEMERLAGLRDLLWRRIEEADLGAVRNTPWEGALANTLNVSFPGCDGEGLIMALDLEGVEVSSGSACMVGSLQPSHVLLAMGRSEGEAASAIRFSLGRGNTEGDVERAADVLIEAVRRQRGVGG